MQAAMEAAKTAIMAISEADNPVNHYRLVHVAARSVGPTLKQIDFDWKEVNKYKELCNFEIDVKNIS